MKEIDINRIKAIPSLSRFSNIIDHTKKEDFFSLQGHLEKIVKEGFMNDMLNYELSNMADKSIYVPVQGTYNYISIIERENVFFSLLYKIMNEKNVHKYYSGYPSDQIICSLSKEGIEYSLFEQPNTETSEILDRNLKLLPIKKHIKLAFGESLCIKKGKHFIVFCRKK